jgi:hypothetical protein
MIREAARGIIASTPVELPVMEAAAAEGPAAAAISGTELPVVQ